MTQAPASGLQSPLAGVRVLDLGMLLPGPVCALHLAWLGADVVKVEPPTGDPGRSLYDGAFFDSYNRGKRSVALDLKSSEGRVELLALVREADVLIENFRPGVTDRLGISAPALLDENPRLIYCSITGFGRGSREAAPAHDLNFLARSGALGAATTWSATGRNATRPAMPVADFGGAAMGVQSILAALVQRSRTGRGTWIEIAMQEVMLHWMAWRVGAADRDSDDAWTQYLEPANDIYTAADGRRLAIGAIEPRLWRALAEALQQDGHMLPSGAFDWDWRKRREQGTELAAALNKAFATRPMEDWIARLEAAGVPADPVATPAEAFSDPWTVERGLKHDDGWIRPPMPGVGQLEASPELDADGQAMRSGKLWIQGP